MQFPRFKLGINLSRIKKKWHCAFLGIKKWGAGYLLFGSFKEKPVWVLFSFVLLFIFIFGALAVAPLSEHALLALTPKIFSSSNFPCFLLSF